MNHLSNNRRRSVVFDGYYGMRNVGDDAFCLVADEVARDRWACKQVSFIARGTDLARTDRPVHALLPERARFRGHVRSAAIPSMIRSGSVVHVGGSTFMQPLTRHRDQTLLATVGLVRLHAVAVSVGPFADIAAADGVRKILSRFASVSVRDGASQERLRELMPDLKVTLGFDVAVLLEPDESAHEEWPDGPSPTRGPVIGVTVCAHETERGGDALQERSRFERTLECVDRAAQATGALVRILVFNDHERWGDTALSLEMASRLQCPTEVVQRTRDPREMLAAVAGCDVVIATRLHSAIFAYASRIPFVVISYQQKGIDVAERMGLPDARVLGPWGPEPAEGAQQIVSLMSGPDQAEILPVEEARRLALESFPPRL